MHPEHCFLTMVFAFAQYGTDHIDYSFEEGRGLGNYPLKKFLQGKNCWEKNRARGTMGKKASKCFLLFNSCTSYCPPKTFTYNLRVRKNPCPRKLPNITPLPPFSTPQNNNGPSLI